MFQLLLDRVATVEIRHLEGKEGCKGIRSVKGPRGEEQAIIQFFTGYRGMMTQKAGGLLCMLLKMKQIGQKKTSLRTPILAHRIEI
jgi:hypothetical protein